LQFQIICLDHLISGYLSTYEIKTVPAQIGYSTIHLSPIKMNNSLLEAFKKNGEDVPKKLPALKTGTTICGLIYKDGVILGADTRATEDTIVAVKNCSKIHYVAKNMYCCGAGTAADTEYVTRMVSSDIELHRLEADVEVMPFAMAKTIIKRYLFQYQGHVSAALILGGYDKTGPKLTSIHPHGSTDSTPYVTMGSGSLAAMAVFESRFKPDMTEEEGKKLVRDAIAAGIFNDLGSGSNIDLCVIKRDKVDYLRPYEVANIRGVRSGNYKCSVGTTPVLRVQKIPIEVVSTVQTEEPMEE
jgi:20S proteasome subunit beta 2